MLIYQAGMAVYLALASKPGVITGLVPRPVITPWFVGAGEISGHTSLLNQHYCTIKMHFKSSKIFVI